MLVCIEPTTLFTEKETRLILFFEPFAVAIYLLALLPNAIFSRCANNDDYSTDRTRSEQTLLLIFENASFFNACYDMGNS